MGTFLRKDILIFLRDHKTLITLFLVPFIATAILGLVLGGSNDNSDAIRMKVAFVLQDNEERDRERFIQELEARSLPTETTNQLQTAAHEFRPHTFLRTIFNDQQMREIIETATMNAASAEQALKNEEVVAILTLPENFTYLSLQKRLLNEGEGGQMHITVDDYSSLKTRIFYDIVAGFTRSINYDAAITQTASEQGVSITPIQPGEQDEIGRLEVITKNANEPATSFQYYAFAEAVLFVLFVASFMAGKAFTEKQQHVFNRILLADKHPLVYLCGKVLSTALLAFIQLMVLLTLSALVFQAFAGKTYTFWLGMVVISAILACCVGTIAALLTTFTFRFHNELITNLFAGVLVTLFAIIGGSFVPTTNLPEILRMMGAWTPNGAALSAYLLCLQELSLEQIIVPLGRLVGISLVCLCISVLIFPRGRTSVS